MFGETFEVGQRKKQKKIIFVLNGNPQRLFTTSFIKSFNCSDISNLYEKHWGSRPKAIRLFSFEGVEIHQEQLSYIRNGDRIYISRGQDFDGQRNFGEYQLVKPLGQGGFGKVWLGKSNITQQMAAIKILKLQKITGASDIDMVFRQVETLKALSHPNIVKILNCYTLSNMQLVVVMEYLEGGELLKYLKQKTCFDQKTARKIFIQIVEAVSHCHREGIIHRDLKLENVLFASKEDLRIKVADFGISGIADTFNPDVDIGTLRYMAPQILSKKQKNNSSAVDVWACGVILFVMVYGELPFSQSTNSATVSTIISGKYSFPQSISVSQQFKSLITWIFQVNPKLRPSMSDIRGHAWLMSSSNNPQKQQPAFQPDLIKTESPKKMKKTPQLRKIMVPRRLQKERQQIIEELKYLRGSRGRLMYSEAKFPGNSSPRYTKIIKNKEEDDQGLKRKRSFGGSKIWK